MMRTSYDLPLWLMSMDGSDDFERKRLLKPIITMLD